MVEPTNVSDFPPTADEVGNHHWPVVANYFAEHGDEFLPHHSHKFALRESHAQTDFSRKYHDATAVYHVPEGVPGCRYAR